MNGRSSGEVGRLVALTLAVAATLLALAAPAAWAAGRWVSGDIHTHTFLSDGKVAQGEVLRQAFGQYGLDFMANSEHGGLSKHDPNGVPFVTPVWRWITLSMYSMPLVNSFRQVYPERAIIQGVEWNAPTHEHASVGIVGAENEPFGISAFEYLFDAADLDTSRAGEGTPEVSHSETFTWAIADAPAGATQAGTTVTITTATPHNLLVGEQVTIAGVAEAAYHGTFTVESVTETTFTYTHTTTGLAASGGGTASVKVKVIDEPARPFAKMNSTAADAVSAVEWLSETYGTQAYMIVNHPSRKNLWHVGDFRAMNDVAPDVAFGMEGLPGHQAELGRGGYDAYIKADGSIGSKTDFDQAMTEKARTYGGADLMTAEVGGVWDALLGEGRRFFIFNNSDFHQYSSSLKDASGTTVGVQYFDFWPGQYAKTWVYAKSLRPEAIVAGMRAGNAFCVNGDLINGLRFKVSDLTRTATMGGTLTTKAGKTVMVTIAVRSPRKNNNGERVRLHHVDVISGAVTGPIAPTLPDGVTPNPAYTESATNPSAKVVRTFTKANWTAVNGWMVMSLKVKATADMYLRLRGTNLAPATPNQTDAKGNPLRDELDYVDWEDPRDPSKTFHGNNQDTAWADLWFYSNPLFIDVK